MSYPLDSMPQREISLTNFYFVGHDEYLDQNMIFRCQNPQNKLSQWDLLSYIASMARWPGVGLLV